MVGGFGSMSMASVESFASEAVLKSVSVKLRLWLGIAMNSQAQKPTMLQRGMDIASKMRELAAKRVTMPGGFRIPVGGTIAGTLGALSYSPDLGPKVPQSGPFRGMEINPQTGRPFTEQELAMYR